MSALGALAKVRTRRSQSGQPLFASSTSLSRPRRGVIRRPCRRGKPSLGARALSRYRRRVWAARVLPHSVISSLCSGHRRAPRHVSGQGRLRTIEGIAEPGPFRFVVDQVEALIELGQGEDAVELSTGTKATRVGSTGLRRSPTCARCRGLWPPRRAPRRGSRAYEQALDGMRVELPLDGAYPAGAWGAAAPNEAAARSAHDAGGCAGGVRANRGSGLGRAGADGTQAHQWPRRDPGALTPAEERVATLVAEGKTNREVAAALYLSDRTVEGHLARIFGKLGIRHRAELASVLDRVKHR